MLMYSIKGIGVIWRNVVRGSRGCVKYMEARFRLGWCITRHTARYDEHIGSSRGYDTIKIPGLSVTTPRDGVFSIKFHAIEATRCRPEIRGDQILESRGTVVTIKGSKTDWWGILGGRLPPFDTGTSYFYVNLVAPRFNHGFEKDSDTDWQYNGWSVFLLFLRSTQINSMVPENV